MKTLIKNTQLLDGRIVNIFIEDTHISLIGSTTPQADTIIDGTNQLAIPPFYNMHTHAAMTLFRGYGEDRPLMDWLQNYIWPAEAKMTPEMVYHGTKLACLEMIKSGTLYFLDMYWHLQGVFQAVDEMGLRATLCTAMFDHFDPNHTKATQKRVIKELDTFTGKSELIEIGLGPHAIYTVSSQLLQWASKLAKTRNLKLHTHLAETEFEINQCLKTHSKRPVEYLHSLDLLSPHLYAAHCCWLTDNEMKLLADHQVKVLTNPVSNLKLASGAICPISQLKAHGVQVLLGTDGSSSNNNLDMMEEMKIAAILQKHKNLDPTHLPAKEILKIATSHSAKITQHGSGELKEGEIADLILLDLNRPEARPLTNLASNIVYSMNGSSVTTAICNGKILMQNSHVKGEEEIMNKAEETVKQLLNLAKAK